MHVAPPVLEKARCYLDVQLSRPPLVSGSHQAPSGPFVTLSRECGSGGSALARVLVEHLPQACPPAEGEPAWTVFEQNIVQHMLTSQDLSPQLARFLPEDRLSEVKSSVGEIVGLHPNLWDLVQRSNRFLRECAQRGRAILVGRGANFATAGIHGGIHIRLTAPLEHRERHMARVLACSDRQAAAHVRQVDAARRAYVRSVFDRDIADPLAYDLVINTARIPLDQAAGMVADILAKRLQGVEAVAGA